MKKGKTLTVMDMEMLLGLLREGRSDRNIANTMKLDRRTVKKYRVFSKAEGWLSGALPELAEIHQQVKNKLHWQRGRRRELGEWETAIKELYEKGVAARIIHQRLEQEAGYELSETQVRRYVQTLKKANPQVTIRIETAPGQEAQVDFGKTVNLWDAEEQHYRTGYIFSMVLSWSPSAVHTGLCAICMWSLYMTNAWKPGWPVIDMRLNFLMACRSASGWIT